MKNIMIRFCLLTALLITFAFAFLLQGQQSTRRDEPVKPRISSPNKPNSEDAFDTTREELLGRLRDIYGDRKVEIRVLKGTTRGDAASGVIVNKTAEEITLDTTPCSSKKQLITFHRVYKSKDVSSVYCGKKSRSRVKVTQQ